MMGSDPLAEIVVPLEEGHFHDPEQVVLALGNNVELLRHGRAECSKGGENFAVDGVSNDQDEVARLSLSGSSHGLHCVLGDELIKGRGDGAVVSDADPGKALGANALGLLGQFLHALLGDGSISALGRDGADTAASLNGALEDAEAAAFYGFAQVIDFHAVAGIRLVGAVALHGLFKGKTGQRSLDVDVQCLLEDTFNECLADVQNVIHFDKGHFKVDLGELGLTVSAEILVPEAAGNLHVAVKTGNHGELLIQLRGLGKRIELALMDAGGDEIVPGALRGGLDEHGGLNFNKAVVVKEVPGNLGDAVAHENIFLERRTAKIQVAVFQAGQLGGVHVVRDLKRRGLGFSEDFELGDKDFHVTGGNVFVL